MSISSFAQTGPGGVGNSATNVLWLKADAGTNTVINNAAVNAWNDASGNGNNAAQATAARQPAYTTSVINGMPALFFDNLGSPNNDELVINDNSNLDNTAGLTILAVARPTSINGEARALVSKRNGAGDAQSYTAFFYSASRLFVDIDGNANRFNTFQTFVGNADYVVAIRYDGTAASGSRAIVFVNGVNDITAAETSASIPDNASPVTIGSMNVGDGRPFGGYIAEIIIYRKALLPVERLIAHSYLFAKYGLSSASSPAVANDVYSGDDPANGNYDFEVAGVGVDILGGVSSQAGTYPSGGLGLTQVSGFDAGDYIMYGHAAGANNAQISDTGGMTGPNNARWSRIWYFDVTNASTTQVGNIVFDMSDAGTPVTPVTASNYVLLRRAGQSGNWTEVATANSIAGDQISFNNISFAADGYYTLGSRNYLTSPLPVSLLDFTGEFTEKGVELAWATASENNNDYFTIQRSSDGETFTSFGTEKAAGDSHTEVSYTALDPEPFADRTYYRLLQTDYDGKITILKTIVVRTFEKAGVIEVIPNPSNGSFWFELPQDATSTELKVLNSAGQEMPFYYSSMGPRVYVDAQNLPRGLYFLKLITNSGMHSAKVVIE